MLNDFSVVERGEVSTTVSIVYPQFPVTAFWDGDDFDEIDFESSAMDIDPTSSSDPLNLFRGSSFPQTESHGPQSGQTTGGSHVPPFTPPRNLEQSLQMPSIPRHERVRTAQPVTPSSSIPSSSPIISDFAADEHHALRSPSTPRHGRVATTQPVTPSFSIPRSSSVIFNFTVDERNALRAAAEIRSTRVPDFVRYAYCLKEQKVSRIDLIVELKRATTDSTVGMQKAWPQLEQQAVHVFANDDSVQVVGCIMGFGPQWRYFEIRRSDVDGYIGLDSSYSPSSTTIRSSSSQMWHRAAPPWAQPASSSSTPTETETKADHDLKTLFGDNVFVLFNTDLSTQMLEIVGDRLKELNEDLWYEE
jgi:hypothetical protein